MRRLRKKFPDGTETKTKFVNRLDEIPTDNSTAEDLIAKLAE